MTFQVGDRVVAEADSTERRATPCLHAVDPHVRTDRPGLARMITLAP
jgi:hypothetical protein